VLGFSGLLSGGSSTSGGQTNVDLEGVVHEPLKGSQGTNHEDTHAKTTPDTNRSHFSEDLANRRTSGVLVQLGDHRVGRVRDDGAEDTSNVTSGEGDTELFKLGALGSGLGDDVSVEGLDGSLESPELHHSVGDLSGPQRNQTLVETSDTFSLDDLTHTLSQGGGESAVSRVGGLNSDLHGFPRAQSGVSDEFSAGGGRQVQQVLVLLGVLLAGHISVGLLEVFVETELAETLSRVTDQSGSPAENKTTSTFLGENFAHGSLDTDLLTALDDIEGDDTSVGKTARKNTTQGAEAVEFRGIQLDWLGHFESIAPVTDKTLFG
jgi:hypothetical protein